MLENTVLLVISILNDDVSDHTNMYHYNHPSDAFIHEICNRLPEHNLLPNPGQTTPMVTPN